MIGGQSKFRTSQVLYRTEDISYDLSGAYYADSGVVCLRSDVHQK